MAEDDSTLQKALKASGLDSIRLARGVVGNTTHAMYAAMLAVAVAAWALRDEPKFALALAGIIGGVTALYLIGTWRFSHRNPDLALYGGAELLKLRELQIGTKNHPEPADAPSIEDPENPVIAKQLPENDRDADV